MTTGFLQLWQIFQISCFGKLASHNAKMFPDIIFLRSQGKNLLMIKNEDEIENFKKIPLGKVKVSDVVGVDVPQQDESFHMVRVVLKQLL